MGELPVLPLLLSPLLPEDMLVLADMLPTLPVLSMLTSVRLRLSQRLKLMLVFCMEDMDMAVLDILDLAMVVLAMLATATMARGLLMPSLRLMLVSPMEDMDMVLVLAMPDMDMDILVLDMPDMLDKVLDMPDMVLDMEDMVLDMAVPSMVKQLIYASKSSKAILLLFSALYWGRNCFLLQI